MYICVNNTSNRKEIEVGNTYELFEHEHPKCVWVKIPVPVTESSVGYITIQCYSIDFKSRDEWRNSQIDRVLS